MNEDELLSFLNTKKTLQEIVDHFNIDKNEALQTLRKNKLEGKIIKIVENGKKYYLTKTLPNKKINRNTFLEFKKDKILLTLLILVITLGFLIRIIYPTEPGLWNDDMTTIPTGLLWFYPHNYYPGLSGQGEPALGNLIIGAGCMLSGEDFSNVTHIKPMWYPDRPILLSNLFKAEDYCRIPIYFFGILFFIGIIILSLTILDKYSALFAVSFYAFYPHLLTLSRWIHVDVIQYTFVVFGLIFLWKAYSSKKASKKELLFFSGSMIFFALTSVTKLPSLVFTPFAFILMLEKYKGLIINFVKKISEYFNLELRKKLAFIKEDYLSFVKLAISGVIVWAVAALPGLEFKLKNLILVIQKYRQTDVMQGSSIGSLGFNTKFIDNILQFFSRSTVLNLVLFVFAIYALIILFMKHKTLKEKFVLSLTLLFWVMLFIYPTFNHLRVFLTFSVGLIFLISLTISNGPYSIFSQLKLNKKYFRHFYLLFIIIYILLTAVPSFATSPYFTNSNNLICKFYSCQKDPPSFFASSHVGEYLRNVLNHNKNDTFDLLDTFHMTYYYVNPEQSPLRYYFREAFKQKFGRRPNLNDLIIYFHPLNKTVRYVVVIPNYDYNDLYVKQLQENYEPNHKIVLKHNLECAWIYDLKNLIPKN